MSSDFFARDADLTPSADAIAVSCSRSLASNADFSRAPLAIGPTFKGVHTNVICPSDRRCVTRKSTSQVCGGFTRESEPYSE